MNSKRADVAIIMGSQSDWATMRHAAETLAALGIGHDKKIVSAHRTPDRLYEFAKGAKAAGYKIIMAGAGGAAHLPGHDRGADAVAGVRRAGRIEGAVGPGFAAFDRADAGRHSRRHAGHRPRRRGQRGAAGGGGAGAFAMRHSPKRLDAWRSAQTAKVAERTVRRVMTRGPLAPAATIGIIGGGQLGRMLAMAAARLGYRTIILEPQPDCPAAQVANRQIVAAYDDPAALARAGGRTATSSPTSSRTCRSRPPQALPSDVPVFPPPRALEVSQDRVAEKHFLNGAGISTARLPARRQR